LKKKIIFYIPSIEAAGVEKNLNLLIKYLPNQIGKINIITANKKSNNSKNVKYICPHSSYWNNKNRTLKNIICIYLLIKNFRSSKAVILSFQSNLTSIIISKILRFRILIRLNTSLKKYLNNFLKKVIFKFFYSLSDVIIVNSKFFKKELLNEINLKSHLIYNLNIYEKKRKKLEFFKKFKGLKILNIGRLTDQKDQLTLIRSLEILKKKNNNFRCSIIGGGAFRNILISEIKRLNLEEYIELVGFKNNAEQYISQSDIFVLSSKYEGLPNVLIESQKYGIPIISSNCPTGPSEILMNGKLGELFPVGNYNILANKLLNFSKNKKNLKLKSSYAKKYLKRFDPVINSQKYSKLILQEYEKV
tara:strand:+ start:3979 stop:5061 length:1083 start_codon:yes stop_codon:yes gene_type:complete